MLQCIIIVYVLHTTVMLLHTQPKTSIMSPGKTNLKNLKIVKQDKIILIKVKTLKWIL